MRARKAPADAEKVIGYEGTDPTGSSLTVQAPRGARSVYTLTDMGEAEEPKFVVGQKVQFGKRGPRTVKSIRLTPKGWEYFVPLGASPHGSPYGNTYPTWRRENGLVAIATS